MLSGMTMRATIGQRGTVDLADASEVRLAAGETLVIELRDGGHWYGHGFGHVQPYPLETGQIVNPAFAVNNIQCPAWMCSAGYVLFAKTMVPLVVRMNEGGDGRLVIGCPTAALRVRVFRGGLLREAHQQWLRYVGWPNDPPAAELFGDSLFCSWTQYPRCLTQQRIVNMAQQIRAHGYPSRTLLIDDRWESCFGELTFSPRDFPDPAGMFDALRRMEMDAWLWVTPFVNVEASDFAELARQRILVPRRDGNGAALLKWWGGVAGLVDVTVSAGRDWYREKLQKLLEMGASGFKIDGGDHKYHPAAEECAWHKDPGASGYSDVLLELFADLTPNRCETRTAWRSQGRPILWREGGKDSHWGLDNGLAAMV
jgi:alpha-glucosidase (family GH31 glycosyl hydrolase)